MPGLQQECLGADHAVRSGLLSVHVVHADDRCVVAAVGELDASNVDLLAHELKQVTRRASSWISAS